MEETKECNPSEAPVEECTHTEIPEKKNRKLTPSQLATLAEGKKKR